MATWDAGYISDLPDSAFACVRGPNRFYPHHDDGGALDLPHLRAALSRVGDASNEQCGRAHLEAHAKAAQVGDRAPGKALMPAQLATLEGAQLADWYAGKRPRPLLAIPFGGPLPSKASTLGVDLDGQYFDGRTNVWPELFAERPLLWHHGKDPSGVMSGTLFGKATDLRLEDGHDDPTLNGWWVDVWLKAGERRLAEIAALEKRGGQIFGSSSPLKGSAPFYITDGPRIASWAYAEQTLSTSPQNTRSVFGPMKAVLGDFDAAGIVVHESLRGVLSGLDALETDLAASSLAQLGDAGESPAKAGRVLSGLNEADIRAVVETLSALLERAKRAAAPAVSEDEGDPPA